MSDMLKLADELHDAGPEELMDTDLLERVEAALRAAASANPLAAMVAAAGEYRPSSPEEIATAEAAFKAAASAEPVAWTNRAQLGFLKDPAYSLIPMAMWAARGASADVPLCTHPAPAAASVREVGNSALAKRLLGYADGCEADGMSLAADDIRKAVRLINE